MKSTAMNLICLISVVLLTFRYGNGGRVGMASHSKIIQRNARQAANDGCSRNLRVGSGRGFLTSPGFPNNYPSSSDCRWLLTSSRKNGNITLKIHSLAMEEDTNCRLDYLQVYLGSNGLAPSLGPFCGQISNRILKTNSSQVLVVFHSDPVNEYKGFSLEYYAQVGGGCDKLFAEDSGELQTPSYPNNYPDNADCWMTITVTPGKQISLTFDVVDLEFDEKCNLDYVNVFDGSTENSTLLARFCHGIQKFESTGNSLLLHFHSDETYNKKGFHAKYEAIDRRLQPVGDCLWQREEWNGSVGQPKLPK
ncbi:tolloid-like protein 2 [Uloborus diversus]|uniref:tolloid-like protein 2 n=1 Tax=Uloborus diversus TaxID=327109 RepID=UPI002409AE6A|nr:tolloid-like protein 2 [Uloborus diversus]